MLRSTVSLPRLLYLLADRAHPCSFKKSHFIIFRVQTLPHFWTAEKVWRASFLLVLPFNQTWSLFSWGSAGESHPGQLRRAEEVLWASISDFILFKCGASLWLRKIFVPTFFYWAIPSDLSPFTLNLALTYIFVYATTLRVLWTPWGHWQEGRKDHLLLR